MYIVNLNFSELLSSLETIVSCRTIKNFIKGNVFIVNSKTSGRFEQIYKIWKKYQVWFSQYDKLYKSQGR